MQNLDLICQNISRAETLNALHACRDGHPLGVGNDYKFRNAWALVAQADHFERMAIPFEALEWLERMARAEQEQPA